MVTHESDLSSTINYEAGSMHGWSSGYGGCLETPEEDIDRRFLSILELAETHRIKKVLDFGCGKGEMIQVLSTRFDVQGMEPEKEAREICLSNQNYVYSSTEEVIRNGKKFDLVTMFHVIEHIYKPIQELNNLSQVLRPGGFLLIETPNSNDALLTVYESRKFQEFTYWSHHPMLHSVTSLTSLLQYCGFEIVLNQSIQRYSLDNHLFWLSRGKSGGHLSWKDRFSNETKESYAQDLVDNGVADTLYVIAKKK